MHTKIKNSKSGFALVEIIVATSIILIALLALMSTVQKSVELARQSLEREQAGFLLEEGAEATKIIRDNGWSNISGLTLGTNYYFSYSAGVWSLSTTANTVDAFTRKVVFSAVARDANDDIVTSGGTTDTGTKKVTITVTWPSERGTLTETMSFYVADIFS